MTDAGIVENKESTPGVVIVGGVAGGASCAARLRRLDEEVAITMVERGPHISFANCGLPYHIGGVIEDRRALLVQTPDSFESRFDVDVKILTEVVSIDKSSKTVILRDVDSGERWQLPYAELVLSPGAAPFEPPIPGIDVDGVHSLRTIPDMDRIIEACQDDGPDQVTVVGAGFIGLEVAENLRHLDVDVTVVEMSSQVMPNLDPEMAAAIGDACERNGVKILTDTQVTAVDAEGTGLRVYRSDGSTHAADLVVIAAGVRPEVELASQAGLELGEHGGIAVDEQMRTSDPSIFAIGDAAEIVHRVTGERGLIPLAGPANRQGRLVADVISGRPRSYRGALGTSIIKVFDMVAACTGLSEKTARRLEIPHQVVWTSNSSHASYYPGAESVTLKAIFDPDTGRLLGAQGFGRDGVDKRIDVLATALAAGLTVADLEALDLAYAPPFSSARDPVNQLGAVADGVLRGDHPALSWRAVDRMKDSELIVDVRSNEEFKAGSIPGAINIPVDQLRQRLDELPDNTPLIVVCKEGLRGYVATRILVQQGFEARNLLGGYRLWKLAAA